jgi:polyferredoxin
MTKSTPSDDKSRVSCSFCGTSSADTKKIIEGPGVCICAECVELCTEIINEDVQPGEEKASMAAIGTEEEEISASTLRLALRGYAEDTVFIVRRKKTHNDCNEEGDEAEKS